MAGWAAKATLRVVPQTVSGLYYTGQSLSITSSLTGANFQSDYQINHGGVKFVIKATKVDPTDEEKEAAQTITSGTFTATNAGYHYIYYQVLDDGTDNYEDGDWTYLGGVYINKGIRNNIVTEPTFASELVYNTEAQQLISVAGNANGDDEGVMEYQVGTGSWVTDITDVAVKATNANVYTVNWRVAASANWEAGAGTTTVTIAPKNLSDNDVSISLRDGFVNPVYNNTAKTLALTDIVVTWNKAGVDPIVLTNAGADYAIKDYVVNEETTNINAGTATCNLKSGSTPNYTGGSVEFTIEQKELTAAMFTIADVTYTGKTITQANLTGAAGFTANDAAGNLTADDYTLTTSAKNVTTEKGSTVTIAATENGNYSGELTAKFDVTKAQLRVDATDVTVACLTTVTDEVLAGHYTLTGWVGDDAEAETKPAVTGAPVIANAGSTAAVGTQEDKITITGVGTLAFAEGVPANYTFTVTGSVAADLIVEEIPLTIAFKENIPAFYYKDVVPAFDDLATLKANYFDISTPNAVTAMTIKMYDSEDAEVAAGTELIVGETYTLKVTAETHNVSYLLTDEIADKTITVQKLPITIVAQDQAIAYNGGESEGPELGMDTDTDADEVKDTWNVNVKIFIGEEEQTMATFRTKYEAWTEDFIKELTWSKAEGYSIAEPGSIGITLKEDYDDDNFDVVTESGDVTWTDVETTITLARTDAKAEDKIKEYDGAEGITVKFEARKLKKEQWYALVLPFPTSVTELSSKLGYAVVNILNQNNTDPEKMQFKLHMGDIAANQPFLVKVYNDEADDKGKDLADVTFTGKTITYSANPYDEDPAGNQLIGVYKQTTLEANDNLWIINGGNFNKVKAAATLKPIVAYLKTATVHDAFAPAIYVEDIDGSVTAINSINADGVAVPAEGWYTINGVKLQGAPTEKGIYIQNGKKVVLK